MGADCEIHSSRGAGDWFTGNGIPASSETRGLRCVVGGGVPQANNGVCLRPLLTLNDVEFHIIAFFQGFVAIQLYCRVVNEDIWPVVASDESVALGVVKPLDLTFVLSHRPPPSLHREKYTAADRGIQVIGGRYFSMTVELRRRLVAGGD